MIKTKFDISLHTCEHCDIVHGMIWIQTVKVKVKLKSINFGGIFN